MDELEVRRAVREAYGRRIDHECCAPSASSGPASLEDRRAGAIATGVARLGVGDTVTAAALATGESVVDLGSGPGSDVLRAAAAVGSSGRVIGVDATPEMVLHARREVRARGITNAEIRLGEIEHLPIESGSVDAVLSDCVVNLSPDKGQVFRDAFRILRPGGRLVVADVFADRERTAAERADVSAWCGCVAGAVREEDYMELLHGAGFTEITAVRDAPYAEGFHTGVLRARKPASDSSPSRSG